VRFELSEDQRRFEAAAARLARECLAGEEGGAWDGTRPWSPAGMAALGEERFLGMLYPPEYGGAGAGAVAYAAALREVAAACASAAVRMAVTNMVGDTIYRFGSEEQKRRFLPDLARGARGLGAFALTEPQAGSDAFSIRTAAAWDGDAYVLEGTKAFVTNGAEAAVIVVMAVTRREPREITAFLVEGGSRGVSVGRPERKMGLEGSGTVSLAFDGCRVPARNRLGAEGEGFRIAMQALDGGRIGIASQAVGVGRAALAAAVAYLRAGDDPRRSAAGLAAAGALIADSATELDAAQLLAYRAAFLKDSGRPFTAQAAMAKLFASEAANRACHRASVIVGAQGSRHGHPVERCLRDARVTTIYEGTSEIQRIVIFRSMMR